MNFISLSTILFLFCLSAFAEGPADRAATPSGDDLMPRSGSPVRRPVSGVMAELYVAPTLESMSGQGMQAAAELATIFPAETLAGCERFCAPVISPEPTDIANLSFDLSQFYTPEISFTEACECLERKLEEDGPSVSTRELSRERELLGSRARAHFKSYVLDNFASHVEDVSFFIHNQSGSFDSLDEAGEREVQCLNPQSIENFIKSSNYCGGRLNRAQRERISTLFSDYSEGSDLSSSLRSFNTQIMNSNVLQNGRMYTRRDFDVQRQSLIRISSEFHNSTRLLQNVLKDAVSSSEISSSAGDKGISPFQATTEYIFKLLNERNFTKLNSLIPAEILDKAKTQGVIQEALLKDELQKVYGELLNHPTTKRILTDKALFNSAIIHLENNSLESLLAGPDFIKEYFASKCERIKHNFANYICVDDDEFASRVQSENFRDFVSGNLESGTSEENKRANQIRTLLACRHQNESGSVGIEERIQLSDNSMLPSDLFARMNNQDTNFIRFANVSSESPAGQLISDATRDYVRSYPDISPERFRGTRSLASVTGTTDLERTIDRTDRSDKSDPNQSSAFLDNSSQYQAVAATGVPTQVSDASAAAARERSSSDSRKELSDFLSNMENREEVERLMNGTSDEMMKELMKLREEMDKNQQRINELLTENQRLKTEEMRRKLENLERDRAALDPGPVRTRSEASVSRDLPAVIPTNLNRSITSPVETGGSSSGNLSASTSGSSDGASLSGLNRALLSSSSGASRGPASETSNPIVVSASGARSGSLEIRSQEVGLDLLNYLSSNGSDIQTLINLKTSGVLYRYQILENGQMVEKEVLIEYNNLNDDVKRIIDQKIAQNKDRASEIVRLDNEIKELHRVYSYSALQLLLAEQMKN